MTSTLRRRLLFAFAAAGVCVAAGGLATAPTGCASDCGSNCPVVTAVIETQFDYDPGVMALVWDGPACPLSPADCTGMGPNTQCNHINVTARASGSCDVLIALYGRDAMSVHLEFGPPSGIGCCKGYPVVGDWHFTIPTSMDAGIYGGDGNTDAVHVLHDAGTTNDGTTDAGDDAISDGSNDDGGVPPGDGAAD
jgi:hypothetical protein